LAGGAEHERVGPVLVLPGNARCGPAGFDRVARHARPVVGEAFFSSFTVSELTRGAVEQTRAAAVTRLYTLQSPVPYTTSCL
jgi:hypothetical protein